MDKELQVAILDMKNNYTQHCEGIQMVAELEYLKFKELQKAGFTRQEAFKIIETRGIQ